MADESESQNKKVQSSHAAEEIRINELAKLSRNADAGGRRAPQLGAYRRSASLPKGIVWGIAALVVLFIVGFGISYYAVRHEVTKEISVRASALNAGVQDLQNFDLQSAINEFSSANSAALSSPSGILGVLGSLFSGGSGAISAFGDLSGQLSALTRNIANMQNDIWGVVAATRISSGGESLSSTIAAAPSGKFVADLEGMRTALAAIDADSDRLSGFASNMGSFGIGGGLSNGLMPGTGDILTLRTQVHEAENFLDAFVPWFSDSSTAHHVLVLFENPSEMRPGGGFLGSYADVAIRGGAVESISVHDIADADAGFTDKVIPPKPLQLEMTGWRPADGNWFFDFPTSASSTISLFERSSLYADTSTVFDGAIAITPQAMSDLLSVTGPVSILNAGIGVSPANGSTTFSSAGLEGQIQKIVQAGQAKASASTYPKKVIGAIWVAVLGKLATSTDTAKQQIFRMMGDWIANKDVKIFFKDPGLENFIRANDAAGEAYVPSQNFNGDYLAIANTDVNSDKSELYVSSTVSFNVAIGSDGTATDHLTVTRTHNGDASPYWWYQTTSQDYMQIFVPAGSSLTNESGGFVKNVPPPINYSGLGYRADPLVAASESGSKQNFTYPAVSARPGGSVDAGKEIFAVWSRTYAGSSTQVSLDYSHQFYAVPADGVQYRFVFERQSGATGSYAFEIDAPLGYDFSENGLSSYVYKEDTMPGRLDITLTLKKL